MQSSNETHVVIGDGTTAGGVAEQIEAAHAPARRHGLVSPATVVVGLSAIGLLLRFAVADQALYGDELYTFDELHGRSLGGAMHAVTGGPEVSPPLYFLLAWAAAKFGDPVIGLRLPSVLLGTLTIPVAYLLGARTVGSRAGLCGAALVALSPFAIFYSSEARPYATAFFLAATSSFALMGALQDGRRRWWVLTVLAAVAALYTHYTTVFVIAAQGAWALWAWPARRRATLAALLVTALAYLPWLPSVSDKGRLDQYRLVAGDLTLGKFGANLARTAVGHPLVQASTLPGLLGVLVLLGVVAVAAVAISRAGLPRRLEPNLALLGMLVLAAPLGLAAYTWVGGANLILPRNLGTSLVPMALLFGALVVAVPTRLGVVLTLVVVAVFAVDAARTARPSVRRPPFDDVAGAIASRYRPGDIVAELEGIRLRGPISRTLPDEFSRRGEEIPVRREPLDWRGPPALGGGRLFVVVPRWVSGSPPALRPGLRLERAATFGGLDRISFYEYRAARP